MKGKRRGLFSLSVEDSEYFNDMQDKFELVSCPSDGINCVEHRLVINKSFLESGKHLNNKDYQRSIEALKSAFYKTTELQETTCLKCAELFRLTITQSLEQIHADLEKMSKSFFYSKRYQSSYELACLVLEELKQKL